MSAPTSTDPFLAAAAAAPKPLLLTEKDVAALLQCSVHLLQQWRAEGVRPPLWVALGPKLVRYPAQALAEWVANLAREPQPERSPAVLSVAPPPPGPTPLHVDGFDKPLFRGGRRRTRHTTFQGFLSQGLPSDEWLFLQRGERRPSDFLSTFADERSDEDEVKWMRLDDYLDALRHGAQRDQGKAGRAAPRHVGRAEESPPGPEAWSSAQARKLTAPVAHGGGCRSAAETPSAHGATRTTTKPSGWVRPTTQQQPSCMAGAGKVALKVASLILGITVA